MRSTPIRGARIRADGNTIYDTVRENAGGMASGWGSALKVQVGASDVTLTRNRVYHNWGEGIAITRGFDVVVRENWSYDNFSVNIYIDNSYRVLVEKNLITCVVNSGYERAGEPATAIQIGEELYAGWGAQLHDVTIQNNIAAFCRRGIAFYASDVGGGLIRVKVHYNTLWGSTNTALSIAYAAPTRETIVSNNLIQQPTGRLAFVERLDGITLGNNYWVGTPPANASTASDRMGDPRLMSVPARNAISFRLAADSPARDGAAELPSPRDDLDGVTRHAASSLRSDMGALEYVAGATPSAFDAIFR